jgi:hypothetical protein
MLKKVRLKLFLVVSSLFLTACGDFPEYSYDQSQNLCVMRFHFAGGYFDRKFIGYFNIVSSLQYLDADPEVEIYVSGPSGIDLEVGSLQKIEIDGQFYKPQFKKRFFQPELQYMGPAFLFDSKQSTEIYQALNNGDSVTFHGRLEVGHLYETTIYNFFFDEKAEKFNACIRRLLSEEDLKSIGKN